MSIANRRGMSEDEVARWPRTRLALWMAFFKCVQEDEIAAAEKARKDAKRFGRG